MRKLHLDKILDIISNMFEAHKGIKKALDKNDFSIVQNTMADLQDVASAIYENISSLENEKCSTLGHISEYNDVLFFTLEKLQNKLLDAKSAKKILDDSLKNIEQSLKNDVTLKKEIAFFPYKASMWDSLETLYLDLKKDPNNEVYCIPIPYYDKNNDGTFGEFHYEGLDYPKNIEVIDYRTYKFESRNPDEIYIHNPYDGWNYVTSVDPRFYAENLIKYTHKLVYSPYFILQEINPDDQSSIDEMKHFIWTPAVIYSDEVILQSDKMKQIYINEFIKAAKHEGLARRYIDRKYLENKFKGIGSPKIDKILRTRKEDLDIPIEWKRIIVKADGSYKKIVLYNTSIATLLKENEKWIEKIEDSFRVFKENTENIVLLWRPHPLIENTIKSMRPQLLQSYIKAKEKYIQEGWGIYDDSTDLDRAVAFSDAYYGDMSSVVNLYQATSKVVMIQNANLVYN